MTGGRLLHKSREICVCSAVGDPGWLAVRSFVRSRCFRKVLTRRRLRKLEIGSCDSARPRAPFHRGPTFARKRGEVFAFGWREPTHAQTHTHTHTDRLQWQANSPAGRPACATEQQSGRVTRGPARPTTPKQAPNFRHCCRLISLVVRLAAPLAEFHLVSALCLVVAVVGAAACCAFPAPTGGRRRCCWQTEHTGDRWSRQ